MSTNNKNGKNGKSSPRREAIPYGSESPKECLANRWTNSCGEVAWTSRSEYADLNNAPKSEHHNARPSEEQQDTGTHAMSKKPFDPSNITRNIHGFQIYPATTATGIERSARTNALHAILTRSEEPTATGNDGGIPQFCDLTAVPKGLRGGPNLFDDLPDLYDIYGM